MKNLIKRQLLYILGLSIMALGIVINTRTDLGVAAISSVPYAYSLIFNISFGISTFIMFLILIIMQFVLLKKVSWRIAMQIPMAIVTSILLIFLIFYYQPRNYLI